jgi:glycerophosphoryl diester phosphodiesterase
MHKQNPLSERELIGGYNRGVADASSNGCDRSFGVCAKKGESKMKPVPAAAVLASFVLFWSFQALNAADAGNRIMLIAHRGGVVDKEHSENSLKAMEEAIRRGYTHVEVDARCTRDGKVVCFHENNMKSEAGIDARVSELTLAEVKDIVLTRSKEHIPTFDEYCSRCKGRINLMVDIKGVDDLWLETYTRQIDEALKRYGLLENTLFIVNQFPIANQEKVVAWFMGRAKIAWRASLLRTRILKPYVPEPAKFNFVFNSPADFSKEEIEGFHSMGLKIIASVNVDHYRGRSADPIQQGLEDIKKMLDWGVDGLQIDSCYDPLVFERMGKK